MSFKKDLKRVMIMYPDVEVKSSSEYRDLINIHNIVETTFGEAFDRNLVKDAFCRKESFSLETPNDYYHLVFKTAISKAGLKKVAYPNMSSLIDIPGEFDIEKWSSLVYEIYDAVSRGSMNLPIAIDYYASTLDTKTSEDEKFKRWMKYYQDGEHLKYSSDSSGRLLKEGFQFPLSGPGTYGPENATLSREHSSFRKMKDKATSGDGYLNWRSKLYSAIRRIDKLLRQSDDFIDSESHRDLADLLHNFDQEVRSLKHQVTAADLSFKYANKFKTAGFSSGHDELVKFAQDVGTEANQSLQSSESGAEPSDDKFVEENSREEGHKISDEFSDATTDNSGILDRAISLEEAVTKLEEVAGRLSDRRTIRMLAEFDIMLDNLGVASMFPELAEAQSKLIDGYSYALTRVTRMLGMLASGKSLVEISDAKKTDSDEKIQKEVDKVFETENESGNVERGSKAIQDGLSEKPNVEDKSPTKPAM